MADSLLSFSAVINDGDGRCKYAIHHGLQTGYVINNRIYHLPRLGGNYPVGEIKEKGDLLFIHMYGRDFVVNKRVVSRIPMITEVRAS